MPIYQYQCQDCHHQLEALQKMSDAVLTDCPACKSPTLKKQLTAASFQLKGTGWYATDFKNNGNKPAPTKANDADSGKGASSTTSESKSAGNSSKKETVTNS